MNRGGHDPLYAFKRCVRLLPLRRGQWLSVRIGFDMKLTTGMEASMRIFEQEKFIYWLTDIDIRRCFSLNRSEEKQITAVPDSDGVFCRFQPHHSVRLTEGVRVS